MGKVAVFIVLGLMLVLLIVGGFFAYQLFGTKGKVKIPEEYNNYSLNLNKFVINETTLTYLLYKFGFSSLNAVPFTDNFPKINLIIGDKEFNAKINKGKIFVEKGLIENEDIKFISNEEEMLNALKSDSPIKYLKNSIINGKSQIVQIASKTILLSKGYYALYKELTGEDLEVE